MEKGPLFKPPGPGRFRRLLKWPGRHELVLLLGLIVFAGGAWVFIELADEVREGETTTIDERILLSLRNPADLSDPLGPLWVEEMCRDFTGLGGLGVLSLLGLGFCGYLVFKRRYLALRVIVAAIAGGVVLSMLLKAGFARPRPDLVPHESYVYTRSFPSGHSMLSTVTYLTLAAMMARLETLVAVRVYLLVAAAFVTLLVGFSRVYLGVHWPTDVLAGWTAGALWTLLCLLYGYWLLHRRKGPGGDVGEL